METYKTNGDGTFSIWNDATGQWDAHPSVNGWAIISQGEAQIQQLDFNGTLVYRHSTTDLPVTAKAPFKVIGSAAQHSFGKTPCRLRVLEDNVEVTFGAMDIS